jgi:hypothetical protein
MRSSSPFGSLFEWEVCLTVTARKVLADCKAAHSLLETESDNVRFRVIWVSGVALLRSVGHVLKGVDSKRDPRTREAIDEAWERWSSDRETIAVFWEFIQEERNNILKEYEFGFMSGPVASGSTPPTPELGSSSRPPWAPPGCGSAWTSTSGIRLERRRSRTRPCSRTNR